MASTSSEISTKATSDSRPSLPSSSPPSQPPPLTKELLVSSSSLPPVEQLPTSSYSKPYPTPVFSSSSSSSLPGVVTVQNSSLRLATTLSSKSMTMARTQSQEQLGLSPEENGAGESSSSCWSSVKSIAPETREKIHKIEQAMSYHQYIKPILDGKYEPVIGKINAYHTAMRDNKLPVRADVYKFLAHDVLGLLIRRNEDVEAQTNIFDAIYSDLKHIVESKTIMWYSEQVKRPYREDDGYLTDSIDLKFSEITFFSKGRDQSMMQNIIRYAQDPHCSFAMVAYYAKKMIENSLHVHRIYAAHIMTYYFFITTTIITNSKSYMEDQQFKVCQLVLFESLSNLNRLMEWGADIESIEYCLLLENACAQESQKMTKQVKDKIPSSASSPPPDIKIPPGGWCSHQ